MKWREVMKQKLVFSMVAGFMLSLLFLVVFIANQGRLTNSKPFIYGAMATSFLVALSVVIYWLEKEKTNTIQSDNLVLLMVVFAWLTVVGGVIVATIL